DFFDGSTPACTGAPLSASGPLAAQATCVQPLLAVGTHVMKANYPGDSNVTGSEHTLAQLVRPATATMVSSSRNPSNTGDLVTFTATISGGSSPTGLVAFVADA